MAGEMLRRLLAIPTKANFLRRIDSIDEQLAVPFNQAGDPQTLGDVGADSKNVGHARHSQTGIAG
jgi:hypothetical protein